MKKIVCLFITALMIFTFAGCGSNEKNDPADSEMSEPQDKIDIDLTELSSTMVYSEVYNMMSTPSDYIGKIVKMNGQFTIYQATDENGNAIPDIVYYACVIADATACCQQGLEFILTDDYTYPEELGTDITVVGEFQTYMEGEYQYCHLVDAVLC